VKPPTGDTELGEKIMEEPSSVGGGDGGEREKGPPILPGIISSATVLIGIVTYQASGLDGILKIMPAILFAASVILLLFSKGKSLAGWILFIIFIGSVLFKFTGERSLPALLSLGLAVVGVVLLKRAHDTRNSVMTGGAVVVIGVALYFVGSVALPQIGAAMESGVFQKTAEEAVVETKTGTSSLAQSFIQSYQRSIAQATGQRLEGDVDKAVKEDVGLEILPPTLFNPTSVNELEIKEERSVEINAKVKGFDPKTPITATTVCHLQTREAASKITTATGYNKNPGEEQEDLDPSKFTGHSFNRDVTCYPDIPGCGNYVITLAAQADHLRTDAEARTNIISQKALETSLRNYAESKSTEIKSQSQMYSSINEIFKGQLYTHQSISQKGAIKVILGLPKVPIIGIDDNTKFKMQIGIENMKKGWIKSVNTVEVTIPDFFDADPKYCSQWDVKESEEEGRNKLVLKESYLKVADFTQKAQTQQKILPSCLFVYGLSEELEEPTLAEFHILVDYNYLVQQAYPLEVKDKDGKPCLKSAAVPSKTDTKTDSSGTGTAASTTPKSKVSGKQGGDPEMDRAIAACQGKSQGESCGDKEFCTGDSLFMFCAPQCYYFAQTGQVGLDKNYDCIIPADDCKQGTIKEYSCKSSHLKGDFTCCIPNT
jgi:hypothetical protein